MPLAAVRFRGKVYFAEYHCDALADCIEDPAWPESHAELERIIDDEEERLEFGRQGPGKQFVSLDPMSQFVRREWLTLDR